MASSEIDYQRIIEGLISDEVREFVLAQPADKDLYIWDRAVRDGELLGRPLHGRPDVPRGMIYAMEPPVEGTAEEITDA